MEAPRARLEVLGSSATAEALVLVFPWAGGNLAHPSVRALAQRLTADGRATTVGVSLPGRLKRAAEAPFRSFQELIPDVTNEVRSLLQRQRPVPRTIVFFGYSLGCHIAWQTLEGILREHDCRADLASSRIRLVMASSRAPQKLAANLPQVSQMTDADFLEYIVSKGGTPREVLEHAVFRAMVLPPLRADYELLETFDFDRTPCDSLSRSALPLFSENVSLKVLYGSDLEAADVEPWAALVGNAQTPTNRWLGAQHFPQGGHFFMFDHVNPVADALIALFEPAAAVEASSAPTPARSQADSW